MNKYEYLATLTALEKFVKAELANVRAEVDDEVLADFEEHGTTQRDLRIGANKVGTVTVTKTKPSWTVTNPDTFNEFMETYGLGQCTYKVNPAYIADVMNRCADMPASILTEFQPRNDWQKLVSVNGQGKAVLFGTQMEVPGVAYVPECVKGTMVRGCDPEVVQPMLEAAGMSILPRLEAGDE